MELFITVFALGIGGFWFIGWGIPDREEHWKRAADALRQERIEEERQREAGELERRRQWEYRVQAMALSCGRCGKPALPVPGTGDRYGCPSCNHRFVGARHDVPLPPVR